MDIRKNLHQIQRYISLDSQKGDFSFLKDINVFYVMVTVNGHRKNLHQIQRYISLDSQKRDFRS